MDLVERYLLNVRTYLPRQGKDDLVTELGGNIRARVEDRGASLGRSLTEEEQAAVLLAHGRPLLVAGQYRSDGRRLVLGREVLGPALADLRPGPAWMFVYLGVLASTALSLVAPALTIVRPGWRRFRWLVSLFSSGAFIAFAAASLWSGARVLATDPRPEIEVVRGAWLEFRRGPG